MINKIHAKIKPLLPVPKIGNSGLIVSGPHQYDIALTQLIVLLKYP